VNWIEQWLGASPDGGDGSLELLLILLAVTAAVAFLVRGSHRTRSSLLKLIKMIAPRPLNTPD
jgi:hypothetical protein